MLPPGPTRTPLANLRRFVRDPYATFWDAAAEYGPVFAFALSGQPAWVSVGEPALIERLSQLGLAARLPTDALALPGIARAELDTPTPTSTPTPEAGPIVSCVDALVDRLRPDQRVRASELFTAILARVLVARVVDPRDTSRHARLLTRVLARADGSRTRWLERVASARLGPGLPLDRSRRALRSELQATLELGRVDEARDVDELLGSTRDLVEGSALTLAWAIYLLSTHRGPREQVLAEARDPTIGSRMTEAVIDETARMRPVVHHLALRLAHPLELGEWWLPAETYVLPSQIVAHFRGDRWESPYEFRPERFTSATRPSPSVYFPLGGAARRRELARGWMRVVLQRLLARLDLHVAAQADPRPVIRGDHIGPSDGVPLVIERVRPIT